MTLPLHIEPSAPPALESKRRLLASLERDREEEEDFILELLIEQVRGELHQAEKAALNQQKQ